jgi:hypothetical protein
LLAVGDTVSLDTVGFTVGRTSLPATATFEMPPATLDSVRFV